MKTDDYKDIPDDFKQQGRQTIESGGAGTSAVELEKKWYPDFLKDIDNLEKDDLSNGVLIADEIYNADNLSKSERHQLLKKISRKTSISLVTLREDLDSANDKPDEKESINHLKAAKDLIKAYGAENLLHAQGLNWKYTGGGLWKSIDDREFKKKIQKNFSGNDSLTKSVIESVLDMVKTEIFNPDHTWNQNGSTVINVKNGELHFNKSTDEWELKPHCRENFRTSQLPVEYDPDAECPRFMKFLNEIFEDDTDKLSKIALIFEIFGYSMLTSCELEKFIMFIGDGANGKSVLLQILTEMIGLENVSGVQPSQFDNQFHRAHLHLKLLNIITELAEGVQLPDAELKAIVSGETMNAAHKRKDPFDFQPYATIIFATNHLPHSRDFSSALMRRAIVVQFNRQFEEQEQDKGLKNKLKKELPGIFRFSLEGLSTLLQRGYFTEPASMQEVKNIWRVQCDQVQQFIEDCCTLNPNVEIESALIYQKYQEWTVNAGICKRLNRNNFSIRLKRLGCELKKGASGKRMISGLEVNQ